MRRSDGDLVEPVKPRGASILSSAVKADGFVLIPEGLDGYDAGQSVEVRCYDDPIHPG